MLRPPGYEGRRIPPPFRTRAVNIAVADRIKAELIEMGCTVSSFDSAMSDSQYVLAFDDDGDEVLKIRVSDHDLPPSWAELHGNAEIEVGDWFPGELAPETLSEATTWGEAVIFAAKRLGLRPTTSAVVSARRAKHRGRAR